METKTRSLQSSEPIRLALAITAFIGFLGFIAVIPKSILAHDPATFVITPLGLMFGAILARFPRSTLPVPYIFIGALGVTIGSLLLLFFDPVLHDSLLPTDVYKGLAGCRTIMLGNVLFLLPLFVRAVQETVAAAQCR